MYGIEFNNLEPYCTLGFKIHESFRALERKFELLRHRAVSHNIFVCVSLYVNDAGSSILIVGVSVQVLKLGR